MDMRPAWAPAGARTKAQVPGCPARLQRATRSNAAEAGRRARPPPAGTGRTTRVIGT